MGGAVDGVPLPKSSALAVISRRILPTFAIFLRGDQVSDSAAGLHRVRAIVEKA